jgi:DNA-binding XRE family transcriptional regulator
MYDVKVALELTQELTYELGQRLKQARLNVDLTQADVATLAGVTRKAVFNAEKGKGPLNAFVAIMIALDLTDKLDLFLPKQAISPIELAKLQGKNRQRASGLKIIENEDKMKW